MDGSDYIQVHWYQPIAGTGWPCDTHSMSSVASGQDNLGDASKRLLADTIANLVGGYSVPLKTVKILPPWIPSGHPAPPVDLEAGG